jgi:hypothetical protein
MNIQTIYASAHIKILAQMNFGKIGLRLVSEYNHDGIPCVWYELDKINYQKRTIKLPEYRNISICLGI